MIHSDFPLPAHDPLLDELMAQRRELGQSLGLPETAATVQVYLFESAERFHEFLRARHPNFPDRRAFFVETDRELIVYAQGGDRLADDLRHEMTHAYLHSVVPGVPLWLDEGLAKNFELPRGQQGLNPQYVQQIALAMQQGGWHPDLRRLERLPATADMSQEDYVEAWAWVHYLLHSQPACRDLLCQYLAEIGGGGTCGGLLSPCGAVVHPLEGVGGRIRKGNFWTTCGSWRRLCRVMRAGAGNNRSACEKCPWPGW